MPVITITVEGGVVVDVEGLPRGYTYRIVDNDEDDVRDALLDE